LHFSFKSAQVDTKQEWQKCFRSSLFFSHFVSFPEDIARINELYFID